MIPNRVIVCSADAIRIHFHFAQTMIDSAQSARIKYALALRDLFFRDERAYWQGRPAYQLGQLGQCITLRSQHAAAKRLIVMLPRPSDSQDRGF